MGSRSRSNVKPWVKDPSECSSLAAYFPNRNRYRYGLNFNSRKADRMLRWAAIFLVIAIIAALMGFTGIAGAAADIARFLFFLFIAIFVIIFLLAIFTGRKMF